MAYNYLLELYETIHQRREDAQRKLTDLSEHSGSDLERQKGRMELLEEFETFLKEHYHIRLPRKIRERIETHGVQGAN